MSKDLDDELLEEAEEEIHNAQMASYDALILLGVCMAALATGYYYIKTRYLGGF